MADKISFPLNRRPDKLTKKGTKPNESQSKLVCIKNTETGEIKRLTKEIIEEWYISPTNEWKSDWIYCPKSKNKK